MGRSGTTLGTVVRWDDARHGAVIEAAELPGGCWADASVVVHSTSAAGTLRAGQVVQVEWTEPGEAGTSRSGRFASCRERTSSPPSAAEPAA